MEPKEQIGVLHPEATMSAANASNIIQFPLEKANNREAPPRGEEGGFFGKGLLDATVRELIDHFARPLNEQMFRDRSILFVALKTALRAQELVQLRWSLALETPEGETVFRFLGKGSRVRYALPGKEALGYVREYYARFLRDSDYLFLSMPDRGKSNQRHPLSTRGLQKIVAGWDKTTCSGRSIHPHALRHTAVQKAMDVGGSIVAQKLAGHSSPETTSKFYTRPYVDASGILDWGEKPIDETSDSMPLSENSAPESRNHHQETPEDSH